MECDNDDNGAAGIIPEVGAIFMSSIVTKKECFRRKLFALPHSMGEFVKQVKAGMVLFLFEFEKRRLFGVYQASSDGGMDIAPHAFSYSGKQFPSQVCFTPIWYCKPLSENEFRDAIRENYYSSKKFNFGLSEVQVHRLLYLFSSKKLNRKLPSVRLPEVHNRIEREDEVQVYDDSYQMSERGYIHPVEHDKYTPTVIHDYQMNSFNGLNEDEFQRHAGGIGEGSIYPLGQGAFLAKRRRIDNDDRFVGNDVVENEIYSNEIFHAFTTDSLDDSLDEVLRLENARRLSRIERVLNENHRDKLLNPTLASDYMVSSLDVSAIDDEQFVQKKKLLSEYDVEHDTRVAFASEIYGNPLDTEHQGERFFDERVQRERDVCDIVKPFVYGDDKVYSRRPSREVIGDHCHSMNTTWKNQYYFDSPGGRVRSFECSPSILSPKKKATVCETIPVHCRIQSPAHISSSMKGFSSENSARPMHYGQRFNHEMKNPSVKRRVTDNALERCSEVESKVDTQTRNSPIVSKEYSFYPEQKQSICTVFDKLPDQRLSHLQVDHKIESMSSVFEDATITRAIPYVPEYPNFPRGRSAAMISNNGNSGLVQENHHQDSLEDFSIMSPYLPGSERTLDITPAGEALTACKSAQQCSIPRYTPTSFQNTKLPSQTAQTTSSRVSYRGFPFQKFSPALQPNHELRNIEIERGHFFNPAASSQSYFTRDGNLATPMHAESVSQQKRRISTGKDSSNGCGVHVYDHVSDLNCKGHQEQSEAPHCNTNGKRKSVFTRLTSRHESWVGKERSGINYNSNDHYTNSSADQIMDMLSQGNDMRNSKNHRLIRKPKNTAGAVDVSHDEAIQSRKEKIDEMPLDVKESVDEIPKETRAVNFKRRRVARKSTASAADNKIVNDNELSKLTGDDSTVNGEINGVNKAVESSVVKILKRRRLIRPVFGKVETASDALSSCEHLPAVKQKCEKVLSKSEAAVVPNGKQNDEKSISSSEADDKQNCDKAIIRSETEVSGVEKNCNKAHSDSETDDKQSCNKAISSSEAEVSGVEKNCSKAHCSSELNDKQNCNMAISRGETEVSGVEKNCSKAPSNSEADDKHNCNKAISRSETEVSGIEKTCKKAPSYSTEVGPENSTLDLPQPLGCSSEEHSNPKGQNVFQCTSHEGEGHEIVALDSSSNLIPEERPDQ